MSGEKNGARYNEQNRFRFMNKQKKKSDDGIIWRIWNPWRVGIWFALENSNLKRKKTKPSLFKSIVTQDGWTIKTAPREVDNPP